jgi:hypothetical protein
MKLSFVSINGEALRFHSVKIPKEMTSFIRETFDLKKEDKDHIFSFGRFTDYDDEYHGDALRYLFQSLSLLIEESVKNTDEMNSTVTYRFANEKEVTDNLSQGQLLFLSAILHHLNVKPYLLAIVNTLLFQKAEPQDVLIETNNVSFSDIESHAKNERFTMTIYRAPAAQ